MNRYLTKIYKRGTAIYNQHVKNFSYKFDLFASLKNKKEDVRTGITTNSTSQVEITEEYRSTYLRLLEGNKSYVQEKTDNNPDYFREMAKTQKPKYLLIGCSDSRVPPNELTKTDPGEIFIHRNIANQVLTSDLNCMSVIQFAVEYLKVEHIIVMGHTKCGGVIAANKNQHLGLIDQWLNNIRDVAQIYREELSKLENQEDFLKALTELNVKHQTLNVCKTSFVQNAWNKGVNLHVHGWLCDIETGLIKDLTVTNEDWEKIKNVYSYKF
jgi:carbonic anhydrase